MIEILNRQRSFTVNQRVFRERLKALTRAYRLKDVDLTLAFIGARAMRRLNREFRKIDRPTDVLSFATPGTNVDQKLHLGDILLCVPWVRQRSGGDARRLEAELLDLAVHGFLHLIGFDHGRGIEEEEQRIRRRLAGKPKEKPQ